MHNTVQDIDSDNILINWVGGRYQPQEASKTGQLAPFRSLFPSPIRYYINDFELAVTFDPETAPSSRVVTGLPTSGVRTGEYARDIAPEMLSGAPYCPFRADIWQLGTMFKSYFGVCHIMLLNHLSEGVSCSILVIFHNS